MKSSLAFDANRRVDEYRRSVLSVQENVLLFKGFLGPALRERRGMATVGMRAARAAGVIVDADGKLRCPPGTPNANQFTDLQMSNCMVPGADAIRRGMKAGRREIGQILASINEGLTNEKKSRLVRAAVTAGAAYLEALDYTNFESAAGPVALIAVDILRAGGRDTLEKAFDALERRNKITPEQRKDLDKMLDALHEQGMAKWTAGLMAQFRGRKDRKRRDRVDADGRLEGPDAATASPSRLVEKRRKGELLQVTFNPDEVNERHAAKRQQMLDKYIPDLKDRPPIEFMDELKTRMGVQDDGISFARQVKGNVDELERSGPREVQELRDRAFAQNEADFEARKKAADKLEALIESLKTPEGRRAAEERVAKNYVEVLMGAEMVMEKNPELRGRFTMQLATASTATDASAYAKMENKNGSIFLRTFYNPLAMSGFSYDGGQRQMANASGEIYDYAVKMAGTDTGMALLGVHEVAHIAHYAELMRTIGIDAGKDQKTVLEQLREHGPRLGDSYVGAHIAAATNVSMDTTWDSIISDPEIQKQVMRYQREDAEKDLADAVAQIAQKIGYPYDLKDGSAKSVLPRGAATSESREMKILESLISVAETGDTRRLFSLVSPTALKKMSIEDINKMLSDVLDGQSLKDFTDEGEQALASVLGYPPARTLSKGLRDWDGLMYLENASEYAQTNIMESIAEARTLMAVLEDYPVDKPDDFQIDRMKSVHDSIVPRTPVKVIPKMTPEATAWFLRLNRIAERLPKFPEPTPEDYLQR